MINMPNSNNPVSISSYLIVKNEVKNIPLLVEDLRKFSDEIIMVDTGSTDGTLEWLKENQDDVLKLYEFEWVHNFSIARNFSLSKVTKEWSFWCDADDRLSEDLINELQKLKYTLNDSEYSSVAMIYNYCENCSFYRHRLFKMQNNPIWECCCHECIYCENMTSLYLDKNCTVNHNEHHTGNCFRNIEIFEKNINSRKNLSTRELYYYARELVKVTDRHYEATQIALTLLFNENNCNIDVWNSIHEILQYEWIKNEISAKVGISIINRVENIYGLRGDICYIRALLHYNIGNKDECIKDCFNALNTVVEGVNAYGENITLSKIYPAEYLLTVIDNEDEKIKITNILKKYEN